MEIKFGGTNIYNTFDSMKIDIKRIISDRAMTKKAMADILYPMNAHPVPALDRILNGESFLDENQISLLAMKLNVPVGDLFENGWKASAKGRVHTFTDGNYRAELNTNDMSINFYVEGTLKHETILASPAITVTQLITLFNKLK